MKFIDFLNGKSPETYLDEKLKICKDLDELPRELTKCSCCSRHRINFPILSRNNTTYYSQNNENGTCEHECMCPCRHIARYICKKWDIIHEVEDIGDTSDEESSSDDSAGSLEDFIVPDEGLNNRERNRLNKLIRP